MLRLGEYEAEVYYINSAADRIYISNPINGL